MLGWVKKNSEKVNEEKGVNKLLTETPNAQGKVNK